MEDSGDFMKKVVCWDFDGTLVYSHHLWSSNVLEALKVTDPNTDVTFADIRKYMAYGFTWNTPNEDYSNMTNDKWWVFMNKHIYNSYLSLGVDEKIADIATKKVHKIIKRIDNYNLYDDAKETLNTLKNMGVVNVLLSNNYPDLNDILVQLDLVKYFDKIVISAVEGYDKPRKELFEIAKSGYENTQFYMVGDNENADVVGGKNANMTTILVHKGYSEKADYCFDDLKSITKIIL